jgi:radical SAM superfamily enzyme YgiQ (UPF0313 family)
MIQVRVALLSTYELGRQPFGLASPAAWLRAAGHEVAVYDLARPAGPLPGFREFRFVAFFLPMHTATRLALQVIDRVRGLNPAARICCYGLYAAMNEELLRARGVEAVIGGEFEQPLVDWVAGREPRRVSLERQTFVVPDRSGLAPLAKYAQLTGMGEPRTVGYTEATRGCKHMCRHCPVVPVYQGAFRVVQRDVVLADIRQQVASGARHITFGDPDFFNGPTHALAIVEALHAEFPDVTYDVTIKIEHLLQSRGHLPALRRTGCLFVTSAVESVDDAVLARFAKGHTRADFRETVALLRDNGLTLNPTFVAFTPWTTREAYRDLLEELVALDLVANVAPIQLAIRLLIPAGSLLLDLSEVCELVGPFDAQSLAHPWRHPDPAMDELCHALYGLIGREEKRGASRAAIFEKIWELATGWRLDAPLPARATIPYLTEPWYC